MGANVVSFAAVKRAVQIEAVLTRYGLLGTLTLRGANLTGRCPFCNGSSERHFRVSPEKNAWYCFGCKQGGNVLDFVAKREGQSLRAAALLLNDWFALGLTASNGSQPEASPAADERPQPAAEVQSPEEAEPNPPLTFTLKTLDPNHPSLAMLGLSDLSVQHFGLGFCSRGLLKGRIAVPVQNGGGELVAYAGLSPDPAAAERYLFPPKFHSHLEVFNLQCQPETSPDAPVYVAAEILGALHLVEAGVEPVLGLFDGTLSERQYQLLCDRFPAGSRLILAGASFEARAVARLTEHFLVRTLSFDAIHCDSEVGQLPTP
jgi:DNA primase